MVKCLKILVGPDLRGLRPVLVCSDPVAIGAAMVALVDHLGRDTLAEVGPDSGSDDQPRMDIVAVQSESACD